MDFISFGFLVLPQPELTPTPHLPGCNQQGFKIHIEALVQKKHFVKPGDADLESGSSSDCCFLLFLMCFPMGRQPQWVLTRVRFRVGELEQGAGLE